MDMDISKESVVEMEMKNVGERNIKGIDLVFHGISLTKNKREILQDVFGGARQGDMLALMGPSGAGKTSLLNAIAGRVQIDSGEVLANGVKFTKSMRRQMCYVRQQDIFFPMLTLKETLVYWALLKLPDRMPWKEKKARVNEVIDALDLRKCANTIIGDVIRRGLSGGEKKRTNIACELLTNPALMLMDEPTSGLDSTTAHQLVVTMKRYTEMFNKTVITAIHQPSSQTFHKFDKVLLLSEGKVAYYGRGSEILSFFEKIGLYCQPHCNLADFILDSVKSEEPVQAKITTAGQAISQSDFWLQELKDLGHGAEHRHEANKARLVPTKTYDGAYANGGFVDESGTMSNGHNGGKPGSIKLDLNDRFISDIDEYYDPKLNYQTSFLTQFGVLFVRNIRQARYRILAPIPIVQTIIVSIYVSLLWFQIEKTEETLKDRRGLLFFPSVYWGFGIVNDPVGSFPSEQVIILKEREAGAYRLSAYFLSKFLSDTILLLLLPMVFISVIYWATGLNGVHAFFSMCGIMCLHVLVASSAGFMIAVFSKGRRPNIAPASLYMLMSMLAGGFYTTSIPFWLDWVKYLSFVRYVLNSFVILEFTNAPPIRCAVESSQSMFEECRTGVNVTYVQAERFLDTFDSLTLWQNILCLVTFFVIFRIVAYLILRFLRGPKRQS